MGVSRTTRVQSMGSSLPTARPECCAVMKILDGMMVSLLLLPCGAGQTE